MKKVKNEILKFSPFELNNRQSLINFYKVLNKEYICGELHQNIILNPEKKSPFLYLELRKNEITFGFKDTNNDLYQQLVKIKDKKIFGQTLTIHDEQIAHLIKDIKNYSYIQGGALVTFDKTMLKNYVHIQLQKLNEIASK
ncbi:hypothetical protein, conserved [Plasmodium gonderi]|uniref:Uncharacterized protein n=1 Tax=Plasmodium gonderi TaxID=77519 RepID=A0A1Y1JRN1_PLAGO|nr:hypothetical protein, conserved [Plasmodium gonderi]GAW83857.1 hypothetical protein, conserved [Plasmodium gonderi]